MVKYVLHYFKVNARGEGIRLAFKLAGVDFEEKSFDEEEWPQIRDNYPTRETPALEIDGQMLCQSKAILRFLGKEFGFHGKTNFEAAFIDQAIDMAEDIWAAVNAIFVGPKEGQPQRMQYVLKEVVPSVYERMDRLLGLDIAGDFFVGNSITTADLFFVNVVDFVDHMSKGADSLEKYPKLQALKSRVAANPKIAAWLAVRPPETVFQD